MLRKTPYPLKKLSMYYDPKKLKMSGGTIDTAIIQEPQLLHFEFTFPKDFKYPLAFYKLGIKENEELTFKISMNNSNKNDMIFTGISSYIYSKIMTSKNPQKLIKDSEFRFVILLEQQSIISLVSLFETFIRNVLKDFDCKTIFYNNFRDISKSLKKCGVEIENLEGLKNKEIFNRIKEILKYVFSLRNLYVHNGGIINEKFYNIYQDKLNVNSIGKLIRTSYNDYNIIRQWLSFLIQEICREIEGYENVWKDYIISSGIIVLDVDFILKTINGKDVRIKLQDGLKLKGQMIDENIKEIKAKQIIGRKNNDNLKTFHEQFDIQKLLLLSNLKKKK